MRLAPVLSRLKTACPALKMVGGAADYAAVKQLLKHQLPAAFVIPLGEVMSGNGSANAVSQRVDAQFGVVLAQSNLRDAGGASDIDAIAVLRAEVRAALLGYCPDEHTSPIEAANGKLLDFDNSVLWWQDDYRCAYFLRGF